VNASVRQRRTEEQVVSIRGVTTYTKYFYEIIELA
jgi:hypothetical protein